MAGGLRAGVLDRLFTSATVADVDWAAPRIRAIRLVGAGELAWTPGQQLRVAVQDILSASAFRSGFRDVLRTYSVWALDADGVELRVLDHGDAPGARWAREVQVGDVVRFRGPEGDFVVDDDVETHLFVGDETATVAFGPMVRAARGRRIVVAEVDSPDDRLPFDTDVHWTYRHGRPAAASQALVATLAGIELPSAGRAYLAGEARTVQLLRSHLVGERGWSRRDVRTKPFWTPGKRGLE